MKGKLPNAWKLYDMLGNVFEWTGDWWEAGWDGTSAYWASTAVTDPKGPATGSDRVCRGGCWNFSRLDVRAAARNYCAAGNYLGFRPARSLP